MLLSVEDKRGRKGHDSDLSLPRQIKPVCAILMKITLGAARCCWEHYGSPILCACL